MGPLNSLTGSELLHLAFLVTPSTLSKLIFSTSNNSSISQIGVNFPQMAQPASSNTSGEVSAAKSDTIGGSYTEPRILMDSIRSPGKVLELDQESTWSPSGVH